MKFDIKILKKKHKVTNYVTCFVVRHYNLSMLSYIRMNKEKIRYISHIKRRLSDIFLILNVR